MNKLYLYNTLSRKKEDFKPIKKGRVGLYTCGPTVYNYAHIGNLRSYVFADILVKILKYNFGQKKVKWVMNVTDVDDKTIKGSKIKYPDLSPKEALKKFTSEFEKCFWDDLEKLNIPKSDFIAHATDIAYIKKMQNLVKNIYKFDYAYIKGGSVYFDVLKYSQKYKYGLLVDIDIAKLKSGVRVDSDDYDKDNVQDFVLWKGKKEGEPSWDFKLDKQELPGRPGWHIECSAMGKVNLGMPFDIHTGGVDLKFPHHENEIHQSVIGYKVKKPVNYWLHNEHLLVDGKKMGKRFNNFYTLKDLENKSINPLAFRFLCLQTGYGKVMNFTWEALKAAQEGLEHLYNQVGDIANFSDYKAEKSSVDKESRGKFLKAINDDMNMSEALAIVQEVLKSNLLPKNKYSTILEFDQVLGLKIKENLFAEVTQVKKIGDINYFILMPGNISNDLKDLIFQRQKARHEKKYEESDKLRSEIENRGYVIKDTKDGQRVYKK